MKYLSAWIVSFFALANAPGAHLSLLDTNHVGWWSTANTLAYKAAAMEKMLEEANYFADRLKLPTPRPMRIADVTYSMIAPPFTPMCTLPTTNLDNTSLSREQRLRSIRIGVGGVIETTNFFFSFDHGRLWQVERLQGHNWEYCDGKLLDSLVGKPSLINEAEAHQLATQWLATVGVDVAALEKKYPPEVDRFRILPSKFATNDATMPPFNSPNVVAVPVYVVHWGWRHYTPDIKEAMVDVKILGTTKELMQLRLLYMADTRTWDAPLSHRPPLLMTNALDLILAPDPPTKHPGRIPPVTEATPQPQAHPQNPPETGNRLK
jgi:hypothetical protein